MENKLLIKELKDCFSYVKLLIKQKDYEAAERVLHNDAYNLLYKQMTFNKDVFKLEQTYQLLEKKIDKLNV